MNRCCNMVIGIDDRCGGGEIETVTHQTAHTVEQQDVHDGFDVGVQEILHIDVQ